jgi:hypothetical protein
MNMGSHLAELKKKHETLDKKIEIEQRSPAFDNVSVLNLKRQKLKIKEEIHRCMAVDS